MVMLFTVKSFSQTWVKEKGTMHFVFEKDTMQEYGRYWIKDQFFLSDSVSCFVADINSMVTELAIFYPDTLKQIFANKPTVHRSDKGYESINDIVYFPFGEEFGITELSKAVYQIDYKTFVIAFNAEILALKLDEEFCGFDPFSRYACPVKRINEHYPILYCEYIESAYLLSKKQLRKLDYTEWDGRQTIDFGRCH